MNKHDDSIYVDAFLVGLYCSPKSLREYYKVHTGHSTVLIETSRVPFQPKENTLYKLRVTPRVRTEDSKPFLSYDLFENTAD